MFYHILTKCGDRTVNSVSFKTKVLAEIYKARAYGDQKRFNEELKQRYLKELREFVMNDNNEFGPTLFQYGYAYEVEECRNGPNCISCQEAGLILEDK